MVIEINTTDKTVTVSEGGNLKKLVEFLKRIDKWEEYTIISKVEVKEVPNWYPHPTWKDYPPYPITVAHPPKPGTGTESPQIYYTTSTNIK